MCESWSLCYWTFLWIKLRRNGIVRVICIVFSVLSRYAMPHWRDTGKVTTDHYQICSISGKNTLLRKYTRLITHAIYSVSKYVVSVVTVISLHCILPRSRRTSQTCSTSFLHCRRNCIFSYLEFLSKFSKKYWNGLLRLLAKKIFP